MTDTTARGGRGRGRDRRRDEHEREDGILFAAIVSIERQGGTPDAAAVEAEVSRLEALAEALEGAGDTGTDGTG